MRKVTKPSNCDVFLTFCPLKFLFCCSFLFLGEVWSSLLNKQCFLLPWSKKYFLSQRKSIMKTTFQSFTSRYIHLDETHSPLEVKLGVNLAGRKYNATCPGCMCYLRVAHLYSFPCSKNCNCFGREEKPWRRWTYQAYICRRRKLP